MHNELGVKISPRFSFTLRFTLRFTRRTARPLATTAGKSSRKR